MGGGVREESGWEREEGGERGNRIRCGRGTGEKTRGPAECMEICSLRGLGDGGTQQKVSET